jgi:hypothetical protein
MESHEAIELATLDRMDWFGHKRLLTPSATSACRCGVELL